MTNHTSSRSPLRRLARLSALAGGLLALIAASARAQTYNVSLDTTGLTVGHSYALDLSLSQGGATPDSTVNVGSFLFGGGGSADTTDTPQITNMASGDLSSAVKLQSSAASPVNEFTQNFNNGSSLGFTVDATNLMAQVGGAPDQFFFDLYDNTANAGVTSTDTAGGGSALFTLERGVGGAYTPTAYGYGGVNGPKTQFSTPSATPELGTMTSLGLLMGLFGLRARRGRARGAR